MVYNKYNKMKREYMKYIYLNIFVLLTFLLPVWGIDFMDGQFSAANEGIQLASFSGDEKKYANISILLNITTPPLSNASHEKEKIFVISEAAFSLAAKDLERLSEGGKRAELIEMGELQGLYGEAGFPFAIRKIPIKLNNMEINFSLDDEHVNVSSQESIELTPSSFPEYEIFEGRKESAGGVGVIWDY